DMTKMHFLLFLFAAALLAVPQAAYTQGFSDPASLLGGLDDGAGTEGLKGQGGVANQYAKKYQKGQNAVEVHNGLLPEASFGIYFVRPAGIPSNHATLRMTSSVVLNGCVKMTQPS